jgi:hypothetical protein
MVSGFVHVHHMVGLQRACPPDRFVTDLIVGGIDLLNHLGCSKFLYWWRSGVKGMTEVSNNLRNVTFSH